MKQKTYRFLAVLLACTMVVCNNSAITWAVENETVNELTSENVLGVEEAIFDEVIIPEDNESFGENSNEEQENLEEPQEEPQEEELQGDDLRGKELSKEESLEEENPSEEDNSKDELSEDEISDEEISEEISGEISEEELSEDAEALEDIPEEEIAPEGEETKSLKAEHTGDYYVTIEYGGNTYETDSLYEAGKYIGSLDGGTRKNNDFVLVIKGNTEDYEERYQSDSFELPGGLKSLQISTDSMNFDIVIFSNYGTIDYDVNLSISSKRVDLGGVFESLILDNSSVYYLTKAEASFSSHSGKITSFIGPARIGVNGISVRISTIDGYAELNFDKQDDGEIDPSQFTIDQFENLGTGSIIVNNNREKESDSDYLFRTKTAIKEENIYYHANAFTNSFRIEQSEDGWYYVYPESVKESFGYMETTPVKEPDFADSRDYRGEKAKGYDFDMYLFQGRAQRQFYINCFENIEGFPLNGVSIPNLEIKSSNDSIVSVSLSEDKTRYNFNAHKLGTATITVSSVDDPTVKLTFTAHVYDYINSIKCTPSVQRISNGETVNIKAQISPSNNIGNITWKAKRKDSDESLPVGKDGAEGVIIDQKSNTEFSVTANFAEDSVKEEKGVDLLIYPEYRGIYWDRDSMTANIYVVCNTYGISNSSLSLSYGGSYKLSVLDYISGSVTGNSIGKAATPKSWTSSNPDIATVDSKGVVTANRNDKGGTTIITAKMAGGQELTCKVTVSGAGLDKSFAKMEMPTTDTLNLSFVPTDSLKDYFDEDKDINRIEVEFSENGKDIASVGRITQKIGAPGTLEIPLEFNGNIKENINVSVKVRLLNKEKTETENEFECIYSLYPEDKAEIPADFELYALTNTTTNLSQLSKDLKSLDSDWEWVDPNTKLVAVEGKDYTTFPVKHTNPCTGEVTIDEIKVNLTQITGFIMPDFPSTFCDDEKTREYRMSDNNCLFIGKSPYEWPVDEYGYDGVDIRFSAYSDNEDIAYVYGDLMPDPENYNFISIQPIAPGKATVKVICRANGASFSQTRQITVVGTGTAGPANIQLGLQYFDDASEQWEDVDKGFASELDCAKKYRIVDNTAPGLDDKPFVLKYTSKDGTVAKVNAKTYEFVLTKPGYTTITATANDVLKSSKDYIVKVIDTSSKGVSLSSNSITFDASMVVDTDDGINVSEIEIFNGFGANIETLELVDKYGEPVEDYNFDVVEDTNHFKIYPRDCFDYKPMTLYVKATLTEDGSGKSLEVSPALTIKVTKSKPSVTIKNVKPVDTLYNDDEISKGTITVSVKDALIEDIELVPSPKAKGDFRYHIVSETTDLNAGSANVNIVFWPEFDDDVAAVAKNTKAKLRMTLAGYPGDFFVEKEFTIPTKTYSMALTSTKGTVYKDKDSNIINIAVNNKTTKSTELFEPGGKYEVLTPSGELNGNYSLELSDELSDMSDGFTLTVLNKDRVPDKGEKIVLSIRSDSWNRAITFPYTISVSSVSKAKLSLSPSTVNAYIYPDGESAWMKYTSDISLTGGIQTSDLNGLEIVENTKNPGYPNLNRTLNVGYDEDTSSIWVGFNGTNYPTAGKTYKFDISFSKSGDTELAKPLKTTLSVKVVDIADASKCITVSAKGKIDILDRTNTSITLTPKFTNLPSDYLITDIPMLVGKDAGLFEIAEDEINYLEYVKNGVITIRLKEDIGRVLSTSQVYEVAPEYPIGIGGEVMFITPAKMMNIKLTQGKATVKATGRTVFDSASGAVYSPITFTALNANAIPQEISDVKLTNPNGDFSLVYLMSGNSFGYEEGWYIRYSPVGNVARGKSYTLKFKIFLKDAAGNPKPIDYSYKVSVQK